jgi:hypothetical protein
MLTIYATEVASITGYHPFKSAAETLYKIWERNDPGRYSSLPSDHDLEVREIESRVSKCHLDISKPRDIIIAETFKEVLESDLGIKSDPRIALEVVTQCINKYIGTTKEESVVAQLGLTKPTKFCKRSYIGFTLGGRIDGIKDDVIYEIKHRVRFWDSCPVYDQIQLMTYLWILSKDNGVVVETLMESPEIKTTEIHFDDTEIMELWDKVFNKLCIFYKNYRKFLLDPQKQEDFMGFMNIHDHSDAWSVFVK